MQIKPSEWSYLWYDEKTHQIELALRMGQSWRIDGDDCRWTLIFGEIGEDQIHRVKRIGTTLRRPEAGMNYYGA